MLALWVALGASVVLVLVLAAVIPWQLARGRHRSEPEVEELLTLDPGPAVVSEQAVLVTDRLVAVDAALLAVRARLEELRSSGPGPDAAVAERQRIVDEAFTAPHPTEEVWASLAGVGERLDADLAAARSALQTARGVWAALDRLPLDRRAGQSRSVLDEADLLVARLLAAQTGVLRYALVRVRLAVAQRDLAAVALAEQVLADVRGMDSLADLRREVDELLENLDLTTRADRMLHPRLAREREGTSAVRALVADRPWTSAADLVPDSAESWKV